jgi:hypothetical protein
MAFSYSPAATGIAVHVATGCRHSSEQRDGPDGFWTEWSLARTLCGCCRKISITLIVRVLSANVFSTVDASTRQSGVEDGFVGTWSTLHKIAPSPTKGIT